MTAADPMIMVLPVNFVASVHGVPLISLKRSYLYHHRRGIGTPFSLESLVDGRAARRLSRPGAWR